MSHRRSVARRNILDDQQDRSGPGPTGDAAVDWQLEALDALDTLPVEEHQTVYGAVHDGLRRILDQDPTDA